MAQVLARDDKIDISNRTQFIFIARGTVIDDFEFEFRIAALIAFAPSLEVAREFVVCYYIDRFQIRNPSEIVDHPFDNRFASHHEQRFRFVER